LIFAARRTRFPDWIRIDLIPPAFDAFNNKHACRNEENPGWENQYPGKRNNHLQHVIADALEDWKAGNQEEPVDARRTRSDKNRNRQMLFSSSQIEFELPSIASIIIGQIN